MGSTAAKSSVAAPAASTLPPSCAIEFARPRRISSSGSGYVHASTSPWTRSGCRSASSCAIMPPIETPTTCARSMPSAVEQARGIVGHAADGVGPGRLRAPPGAAVIEHDRAIAFRERRELEHPGHRVGGEAHDQQQRVTTAVLFVVQLDIADGDGAHGGTPSEGLARGFAGVGKR